MPYLVFALALLLGSVSAQAQQQLVIGGTGDSQSLLRALAPLFEKSHPGTTPVSADSAAVERERATRAR